MHEPCKNPMAPEPGLAAGAGARQCSLDGAEDKHDYEHAQQSGRERDVCRCSGRAQDLVRREEGAQHGAQRGAAEGGGEEPRPKACGRASMGRR